MRWFVLPCMEGRTAYMEQSFHPSMRDPDRIRGISCQSRSGTIQRLTCCCPVQPFHCQPYPNLLMPLFRCIYPPCLKVCPHLTPLSTLPLLPHFLSLSYPPP